MDKLLMIIDGKIVVFTEGFSGCSRRKYLKIARLKEEKVTEKYKPGELKRTQGYSMKYTKKSG